MRSTWANASKRKARDDGKSSLLTPPPPNQKTKKLLVNNLGTLNLGEGQRFGLAKSKINVCDHKQI